MKLIIFLLLLSPVMVFSQAFEGTMIFANSYKSKSPQIKDEQLNSMMGTTQDYFIKGGNYKSVCNGTFVKSQLYRSAENISYSLNAKSNLFNSEDYSKNKDVATKYEIKKNVETVLGIPCDLLIVYTPKTKAYYYYNKKYGVDSELYNKHQFGNWYAILSKTKAVPLKVIYESEYFVMTSIVEKITPEVLDDKVFAKPDKDKIAVAL